MVQFSYARYVNKLFALLLIIPAQYKEKIYQYPYNCYCNLTVLLYTSVCNCRVSMFLVLYVRVPLILAAKLVGLFLHHCIKEKKKKKKKKKNCIRCASLQMSYICAVIWVTD